MNIMPFSLKVESFLESLFSRCWIQFLDSQGVWSRIFPLQKIRPFSQEDEEPEANEEIEEKLPALEDATVEETAMVSWWNWIDFCRTKSVADICWMNRTLESLEHHRIIYSLCSTMFHSCWGSSMFKKKYFNPGECHSSLSSLPG